MQRYEIECLDKVQLSAVYVHYSMYCIYMQQNTAEYSSTYVPYQLPLALQVRLYNPPVPTGLIFVSKTRKAKKKVQFVLTWTSGANLDWIFHRVVISQD